MERARGMDMVLLSLRKRTPSPAPESPREILETKDRWGDWKTGVVSRQDAEIPCQFQRKTL